MPTRERLLVSSGSPYEAVVGFSRAVRVGDTVYVSGTAPIRPGGDCDPDPHAQAVRCFEIIAAALQHAGASLRHVARTRIYITDAAHADAVSRAHYDVFGDIRPTATMVVVAALLRPEWKVEIEADAIIDS